MKKTSLEDILGQLVRQNTVLTEMMAEQQKQLQAHSEKLESLMSEKKKEDDEDEIILEDEPEDKEKKIEEEKQNILTLLGRLPAEGIAEMPVMSEFAKEQDIDNLSSFSEGMFIVLMRRYFGEIAVNAYREKKLKPRLFRKMIRFFDDRGDEENLPISDEDVAAAAEEDRKLAEEAEKARENRLNPGMGRFTLRGRDELENFFNEHVVDIVTHLDAYRAMGIDFPRSFVLEGPPGCGKTYAVERLAEHMGWKTIRISGETVGSTYVHGTSKKIEEVFKEARENAPALIIIDEMDAFLPNRASTSENNRHHVEEVDSFLKCLQNAQKEHILVVGMTNLISDIDPAVLRTGRMGTHITVGMPSRAEIEAVLNLSLEKRPLATDLDLAPLVNALQQHPLSDVTYVAEEAAMTAVRAGHERITQDDLQTALNRLLTRNNDRNAHRPMGFCA